MGCGSSSQPEQVEKERRRLSVGNVDKNVGGATGEDTTEDERGLITQLSETNVIDMMKDDTSGGRKMSIGSNTDQGKTSFANKTIQQMGDDMDPAALGMGYTCRKGLKPESPNQDSWFVLKLEAVSIYAVFDGHGQKGHDVSNFVKDTLPKLIIKDPRFEKREDIPTLLKDSFKKCQSLVSTADRLKKLSAQMSGTTATLCFHDHKNNKITIAHVADSTAVLGGINIKSGGKDPVPLYTSRDHKPDLKDEKARIEKSGGRVVFDGYANHRVYAKNARYPGLNMSRCLGDLMGHQDCGIIAEPEIFEKELDANDKLLLLCSDGVWEFIKPDEAIKIVLKDSEDPSKAMVAAEKLAKAAWDRWITEEGGAVVDDITVVLVHLQKKTGN